MTRLRDKIKELDITIQNKLEQFHLLDKCLQKSQENEDYDCMMDVYMAMQNIVFDLKEHHKEIFEKVPEYCKVFETLENFEPFTILSSKR